MSELRDRLNLKTLLPILFIFLVGLGNAAFCGAVIVPRWLAYEDLVEQVAVSQNELDERLIEQYRSSSPDTIQEKIDTAANTLADVSGIFLSSEEANLLIDELYRHARESNVEITNLQSQQSLQENPSGVYQARLLRLEVRGEAAYLTGFISRINVATLPGVTIEDIVLEQDAITDELNLDILVYVSPYAPGVVLENLAPLPTPTAFAPTPLPETVNAAPPPASDSVNNAGSIPPPVGDGDTAAEDTPCKDAPPTLFQPGQRIVIDFKGYGSLNILDKPRIPGNTVDVILVAPDGHRLTLLDGPICGQWNGLDVWYWQVDYAGVQGWAGEGTVEDRWMCPESEPECSDGMSQ